MLLLGLSALFCRRSFSLFTLVFSFSRLFLSFVASKITLRIFVELKINLVLQQLKGKLHLLKHVSIESQRILLLLSWHYFVDKLRLKQLRVGNLLDSSI